jgi:hypothetical protein
MGQSRDRPILRRIDRPYRDRDITASPEPRERVAGGELTR